MGLGELLALLGAALVSGRLDLESPTVFRGDPEGAFGASVAQLGSGADGWLLVGAPRLRGGSVFGCRAGSCRELSIPGPPGAVNSSLGLAMAAGEEEALVCGPSSPQACGANVHLNGFCVRLDTALRPGPSRPDAFPECPKAALDIALLVDGSGSIDPRDFDTMKTFLGQVMDRFRGGDAQFSLVQFSTTVHVHFDFWTFRNVPDPAWLLRDVRQFRGLTFTATAIRTVLTEMFMARHGARPDARRVLVVVTDGQKYEDPLEYSDVIPLADSMAVTRYAIGVGQAFLKAEAQQELAVIASSPAADHVFRVDNFDALADIQKQLQEKIFAIEGTHPAHSSSFQLEMAQEGFSALLTPAGPVLGAVGAFDWSGGAFVYGGGGAATFVNASGAHLGHTWAHLGHTWAHLEHTWAQRGDDADVIGDMRDAYLGYSSAAVALGDTWALALGAPRYAHLGRVLVLRAGPTWTLLAEATGPQVGSYFGASLLALGPRPGEPRPGEPRPGEPRPGEALRLLVGAPSFYGGGSGGRVDLCELRGQSRHLRCHLALRGSPGQPLGRFGASLAHLGDLDGDGWAEVAVGAPLEDEGRGAVYLFGGTPGGVSAEGAQRIPGSAFPSQPHFFGQSLSGGRDLSGDHLPDLAVGARGQVLLLRSPPLLRLKLQVTFDPPAIPVDAGECPEGAEPRAHLARAQVCFEGSRATGGGAAPPLSLSVSFLAQLDPGRARARADFGAASAENGTLRVGEGRRCRSLEIFGQGCPQDWLSPLSLRVTLSARGDPLGPPPGGLRPRLSPDSDTATTATLPFEHDCGGAAACRDALELSLGREGEGPLLVGEGQELGVRLELRNDGESSFGPGVTLEHTEELSFRKVQVLQPRSRSLRCLSEEPPRGRRRRTRCGLQPPLLRPGAQVSFTVTLDVPPDAELGDSLEVTAMATSDNGGPGGRSHRLQVPLLYSVFLVLASAADSTRHLNVTAGAAPPDPALVTHHYQVKLLGRRGVEANVTFWVPSRLGQVELWEHLEVTPGQEPARCQEGPGAGGSPWEPPPERPRLVCPGPPCREFRCALPPCPPPASGTSG